MELSGVAKAQRAAKNKNRRKFFSVDHANRTLPLVRRIVTDMVRQHKRVSALEDKCHMRRPNVSAEQQDHLRRQYMHELEKLRDLAEELAVIGCEIKDWRSGLIDFRSRHQGREIELCWRLGEDRVEHWHELDTGFAARQKIDAEFHTQAVEQVA
jgi:hypothetical protein